MKIKLVAVSDTHGKHRDLDIPEGDVFVHAGDLIWRGTVDDLIEFNEFLGSLQHRHKIVIAGNHDFCFEESREFAESFLTNAVYLQDEEVVLEGIKFYGSPWQPWFFDWAFNLQRGQELREKWDLIPNDVDVLVTHGPPYGYCDETSRGDHVGCEELLAAVERIDRECIFSDTFMKARGRTATNGRPS